VNPPADPTNPLEELIEQMVAQMTVEDQITFAQEPEDHPGSQFHFSNGMSMRNELHLWEHTTPLTRWFSEQGIFHGDDRSGTIFKALWCRLRNKPFDIKAEAEFYRVFWARNGVNPDGTPINAP
jgi:hypothetical protein